jgi:hypothetical protein
MTPCIPSRCPARTHVPPKGMRPAIPPAAGQGPDQAPDRGRQGPRAWLLLASECLVPRVAGARSIQATSVAARAPPLPVRPVALRASPLSVRSSHSGAGGMHLASCGGPVPAHGGTRITRPARLGAASKPSRDGRSTVGSPHQARDTSPLIHCSAAACRWDSVHCRPVRGICRRAPGPLCARPLTANRGAGHGAGAKPATTVPDTQVQP